MLVKNFIENSSLGNNLNNITTSKTISLYPKSKIIQEKESAISNSFSNAATLEISAEGMNTYLQNKSIQNSMQKVTTPQVKGKYTTISKGKTLNIPTPGEKITVSLGVDKKSIKATVSKTNAWAIEYSIEGCRKLYPKQKCTERLNSALSKFEYNSNKEDLLKFKIPKLGTCYAGAMIEGFGKIGDVVEVTLDNGKKFNFMILDTKSKKHKSSELSPKNQCQNEWGHGYMLENNAKVQLSICEFITSKTKNGVGSAKNYPSGAFLKDRYVKKAKIIGHANIE